MILTNHAFLQTVGKGQHSSQFILHQQHMRGEAGAFRRDGDGLIFIEQGELSYCAPGENDWALRAEELELDIEEGLGTARKTKIAVGGVPAR